MYVQCMYRNITPVLNTYIYRNNPKYIIFSVTFLIVYIYRNIPNYIYLP